MNSPANFDVAVIGAGFAGIATAYFLKEQRPGLSVVIIDERQPMSYTSAQSGDNYRNWWPHPVMRAFTDDSIGLLEDLADESSNSFNLNRRGYLLATRRESADELVAALHAGYDDPSQVRLHSGAASGYQAAGPDWSSEPGGVDVLSGEEYIQTLFPFFSTDIRHVLHVRRAGDISGQQLGQYLLGKFRARGGTRRKARVLSIDQGKDFSISLGTDDGRQTVGAGSVVLATGPKVRELAAPLGVDIPVTNVFQQKVAFEDVHAAVPRDMGFAIDLDAADFGWTDEESDYLAGDPETRWLTGELSGGLHCRPEGGADGRWVKMGWAFNQAHSEPVDELFEEPRRLELFPELVIRAGSKLLPSLGAYQEDLPRRFSHYGGYYTMTDENWPLVGPTVVDGLYVVAALSGFDSMAACGAGQLCASWMTGQELPAYADALSLQRYADTALMDDLLSAPRGVL